jgi:Cu-Zn family superoxide dismutase
MVNSNHFLNSIYRQMNVNLSGGYGNRVFKCPLEDSTVQAVASLKGGPLKPEISGIVIFKDVPGGTEVCVDVAGLPSYRPAANGEQPIGPHGFHIHEKGI